MKSKIFITALGYAVITFVWTVVWHVVLFEEQYVAFNFLDEDPNFILGLSTIVLQGVLLAVLYAYMRSKQYVSPIFFSFIMGAFLWTSHVLGYLAKVDTELAWSFLGMETVYLALQFAVFAGVLRLVWKKTE